MFKCSVAIIIIISIIKIAIIIWTGFKKPNSNIETADDGGGLLNSDQPMHHCPTPFIINSSYSARLCSLQK